MGCCSRLFNESLYYYVFVKIFFFLLNVLLFVFWQEWCERLIEMQDIIDAWLKVCDLEFPFTVLESSSIQFFLCATLDCGRHMIPN